MLEDGRAMGKRGDRRKRNVGTGWDDLNRLHQEVTLWSALEEGQEVTQGVDRTKGTPSGGISSRQVWRWGLHGFLNVKSRLLCLGQELKRELKRRGQRQGPVTAHLLF